MKHAKLADSGLTIQQEQFAQLVAIGRNQTEAYREAYPASRRWKKENAVHSCASALAADAKVAQRIQALTIAHREKMEREHAFTLDQWARQNVRLATSDVRKLFDEAGRLRPIHEIDDDTAVAIEAVKVSRMKVGKGEDAATEETIIEYKLARKSAALDQLGKFLGAFKKDNEQKREGTLDALLAFIAGRARLATVPDVEQRTVEAEDATIINPAPTALLPKE